MIELAVSKKRRPRRIICPECGEQVKSCDCAERQEKRKADEIEAVKEK